MEYDMKTESFTSKSRWMIALCVILCLLCVGLIIGIAIVAAQTCSGEKYQDTGKQDNGGKNEGGRPKPDPSDDIQLSYGEYRFAAVSSEDERCNEIGTTMLARGGSAVDAAIATALCVGVVAPYHCGIGGGFLATVYGKSTQDTKMTVRALNARETAPLASTPLMYVNSSYDSREGGSSVGVPGQLAGFQVLHDLYGKLPWTDLFQPSIELARGHKVTGGFVDASKKELDYLKKHPKLREGFLNDKNETLKLGDMLKNDKLANTLSVIAKEGARAFYNGSLSQHIVDDIKEEGGIITLEDLRQYSAIFKDPISAEIFGGKITAYGPPPPSSSVVIAFILNMFDGFKMDKSTPDSLRIHRLVEAMKFAFGKRALLGDMDFVKNITRLMESLTSKEFAEEYRAKIDDDRTFNLSHYEPEFDIIKDSGTSQISVLAPDGSAVSMTSTINFRFGSKVFGSQSGIIFNNEMDDFSTPGTVNAFGVPSSPPNYIQPKKRPMSSMSPLLLIDDAGTVRMNVGSAGGTRIITASIQTIINSFVLGMDLDKAITAPRVHHQLIPEVLYYEEGTSEDVVTELQKKGHQLNKPDTHRWFGGTMGIKNQCGEPCTTPDMACFECSKFCIKASTDWRAYETGRIAPKTDGY